MFCCCLKLKKSTWEQLQCIFKSAKKKKIKTKKSLENKGIKPADRSKAKYVRSENEYNQTVFSWIKKEKKNKDEEIHKTS